MSFDRFFLAGFILGLTTGIVAFSYGLRIADKARQLNLQTHHQPAEHHQPHESHAALPTVPSNGLGVGP